MEARPPSFNIQHSTLNIQHSPFCAARDLRIRNDHRLRAARRRRAAQHSADRSSSSSPARSPSATRHDVKGVVTATIESGWHINSNKPLDDFVIPTKLSFDGTELVSAEYPPHTVRTFTFSGGQKLAVYEGTIQIPFTAKLQSGDTIKGKLHYQACNDNVCLPPRDAEVTIDANAIAAAPRRPQHPPASLRSPPHRKAARRSATIASPPRTPSTDCR